jgi:signal transduction histidine kinase
MGATARGLQVTGAGHRWFRLPDVLLAAGLSVAGVAGVVLLSATSDQHRPADPLAFALVLAMTVSLAVRRCWPVAVVLVNVGASVLYHLRDYPPEPALPPILIALYTLASTGRRRRSLVVGGLVCAAVAVTMALSSGGSVPDLFGALGWVVVALVLGDAVRYHRAYAAEVEDRAARAERSRAEEALRRVAEERVRIARDLHDVLAHTIAAVNVQAGVAGHLLDEAADRDSPELVMLRDALHTITDTSRTGMAELRAILDVLRGDDNLGSGPVPGLDRLGELTGPARSAGVDVVVEVAGEPRALPPVLDVAAYRIVQEALTNVVRHAHAATARVHVEYGPAALRVTVSDDGGGRNGYRSDVAGPGGYGILGMVERAQSVGGKLTAGPRETTGFQVEAVLPFPAYVPDQPEEDRS